jgi:cytochrome c
LLLATLVSCRAGASAKDRSSASEPSAGYALGRAATAAEIAALDIDVDTSGAGLPPGRGDATRGESLYRAKCAVCHGANGEGIAPNPALIGRDPRNGFPFASDFKIRKTIGNYWPYATTLFDYIRRAMPLAAPGTLSGSEVYSLTAYLLAANEIIPAGSPLDSASLRAVHMPARNRFVRDDRAGGREVK